MPTHRNPRPSVQATPAPDNFDPADALESLHTELTQLEAFAHAAGEAIIHLPAPTDPAQRRAFNRVYTLVTKVANDITTTVSHGDHLIAALSAHLANASPDRD
jgi:hypothetical protein